MTAGEIVLVVGVAVAAVAAMTAVLRKVVLEGMIRVQDRVQQDFQQLRGEVDRKLSETVTQNAQGFSAVADKLGKLHEATGQVVELSKGVNDLNVLLKTPTGRGSFGEMTLEQMLGDLFGDNAELFATQHVIEGGERADAVVFVRPDRSLMLCVDAKFPLANAAPLLAGQGTPEIEKAFAADVRARADEIKRKYIKPPKTLDFAFMFVPSEAVYYQLLRNTKLHQDLLRDKVMPTSPNAFYAYLQALSTAFRGVRIEQKALEIQKQILQVGKEFGGFAEDYDKLGERLELARKAYDESVKHVERFARVIDKIRQGEVNEAIGSPPPALSQKE